MKMRLFSMLHYATLADMILDQQMPLQSLIILMGFFDTPRVPDDHSWSVPSSRSMAPTRPMATQNCQHDATTCFGDRWIWISMGWFKAKIIGSHGLFHESWGFPADFPVNQCWEKTIELWHTYSTFELDATFKCIQHIGTLGLKWFVNFTMPSSESLWRNMASQWITYRTLRAENWEVPLVPAFCWAMPDF